MCAERLASKKFVRGSFAKSCSSLPWKHRNRASNHWNIHVHSCTYMKEVASRIYMCSARSWRFGALFAYQHRKPLLMASVISVLFPCDAME